GSFQSFTSSKDGKSASLQTLTHWSLKNKDEERTVLTDIQVINPESIVEWAVDNLEPLCRKVCRSIKKIDNYLQSCNPPNEEDLYMSLIMGIKTLQEKLCTESDFIKRYCIYYPCLHELRNDFETCNGPADWNEDPDKNEMCKAYKEIVDCYYIKAAKVCGYDAAAAVKELMKDVINSVIRIKCSGINRNPYVEDPMPETYIKRSQSLRNFFQLS
ncbi:hypothetical protein NQ318_009459, partial [Aromia moschata]